MSDISLSDVKPLTRDYMYSIGYGLWGGALITGGLVFIHPRTPGLTLLNTIATIAVWVGVFFLSIGYLNPQWLQYIPLGQYHDPLKASEDQ